MKTATNKITKIAKISQNRHNNQHQPKKRASAQRHSNKWNAIGSNLPIKLADVVHWLSTKLVPLIVHKHKEHWRKILTRPEKSSTSFRLFLLRLGHYSLVQFLRKSLKLHWQRCLCYCIFKMGHPLPLFLFIFVHLKTFFTEKQ